METFLIVAAVGFGGYAAVLVARSRNASAGLDADKIRCPYCQVRGGVSVRLARRGNGGARATAGPLAERASTLVAGLSGKQAVRQLSCSGCGARWEVG